MAYNPKEIIKRKLKSIKRALKIPNDKKKYVENMAKKMDKNPTWIELSFIEMLKELNIKFETQKIIQNKIFDFYISDKHMLVELDGSYWHGYNKTFTEMDHIQKKTYKNDRKKDILAKGLGYNLIRIWEHELEDELYSQTKERIRNVLK